MGPPKTIHDMKLLVIIFASIAIIYFVAGIFLFVKQRSFLYFPTPAIPHNYEQLFFKNEGETISVFALNSGKDDAILYFGGNSESVVGSIPEFMQAFPSHTVYMVEYRGYGESTGTPTEIGLRSDALHIFDTVAKTHQNLSVIGRSLGSGVASYVGAERDFDKLVMVTPFDSIRHLGQRRFRIFPMSILLKDRFESASRVNRFKAEVLILNAEYDAVVPKLHTDAFAAAFTVKTPRVELIKGSAHNDISSFPTYYPLIREFLAANTDNADA